MLLQGNLQKMFDALYEMGVIDPILEKDWQKAMVDRQPYERELAKAVEVANRHSTDLQQLVSSLHPFRGPVLEYLAIEVAREFAEFHARSLLH